MSPRSHSNQASVNTAVPRQTVPKRVSVNVPIETNSHHNTHMHTYGTQDLLVKLATNANYCATAPVQFLCFS